jgi:hypothetical protein
MRHEYTCELNVNRDIWNPTRTERILNQSPLGLKRCWNWIHLTLSEHGHSKTGASFNECLIPDVFNDAFPTRLYIVKCEREWWIKNNAEYSMTYIVIARQRLGKDIHAGANARNSSTSVVRERIS